MAYSTGPYRLATSLPSPGASTLTSSRKIDFVQRRYVTDDDGGFEAMDDVAQRVLLLVCFSVTPQKFISTQALAAAAQDIRDALKPLTTGPEPEIEIAEVVAERTSAGSTRHAVSFRVLRTGTQQTVEVP